jgi:hypothetical protein
VEPVRIKVYGLFSRTRRRYAIEAIAGAVLGFILLAAWWLGWPFLRQRLMVLELPPLLVLTIAVLDRAPWILLGAALYKGTEVLIVLHSFARKEVSDRSRNPQHVT